MKYKVGDKVVVEIIRVDAEGGFYCADKFGCAWIGEDYVLGKLSDFQQQKIKFTKAEKEEFDGLANYFSTPWAILNCIKKYHGGRRSNLYNRVFHSGSNAENAAAQFEFIKAIEHPELIEVEKEKKYYIRILGQYLDYNFDKNVLYLHEIKKMVFGQNTFTQTEIDKLQKLSEFSAIDLNKCKEAVK